MAQGKIFDANVRIIMNGFLVFDVETPNRKNDRICQIGFVRHTEGMKSLEKRVYLVNPDAPFGEFCCGVHGIRARDVQGKPTFAELWGSELYELFANSIIVAHNASFDLGVLSKTLDYYSLEMPDIRYIDTLELSRKHYPHLPNHQLGTVAEFLGHQILHSHDALHDAYAAYTVLIETLRQFGHSALSPKPYQVMSARRQNYSATQSTRVSLDELLNILEFIVVDGRIAFEEAWLLDKWLEDN
jgi:DNA polymerase-3 subunit epsilon